MWQTKTSLHPGVSSDIELNCSKGVVKIVFSHPLMAHLDAVSVLVMHQVLLYCTSRSASENLNNCTTLHYKGEGLSETSNKDTWTHVPCQAKHLLTLGFFFCNWTKESKPETWCDVGWDTKAKEYAGNTLRETSRFYTNIQTKKMQHWQHWHWQHNVRIFHAKPFEPWTAVSSRLCNFVIYNHDSEFLSWCFHSRQFFTTVIVYSHI